MARTRRKLFAALAICLAAQPSWGAFQSTFVSPQSAAMGSASLSAKNDSTTLFTNPAGLGRLDLVDTYFMYNKLYAGLEGTGDIGEGFITVGVPTRIGAFGLGWGGFRASGLKQERTLAVSFARAINKTFQAGLALKHLHHSYLIGSDPLAAQDPVFENGTSRSAFAFDAGLIASISGPWKLGVAVRNINSPDVGLSEEDRVPREVQAGLTFDGAPTGLKVMADLSLREAGAQGEKGPVIPALGIEKAVAGDRLAFRFGVNPLEFSGGFGLKMGAIGFDYALTFKRNLIQDNMGSHMVGFRYQFGRASRAAQREPLRGR